MPTFRALGGVQLSATAPKPNTVLLIDFSGTIRPAFGTGDGHVPVRRKAFDGVTLVVQQRARPVDRRTKALIPNDAQMMHEGVAGTGHGYWCRQEHRHDRCDVGLDGPGCRCVDRCSVGHPVSDGIVPVVCELAISTRAAQGFSGLTANPFQGVWQR